MNETLYAVDSTGRRLARLVLAEGADATDVELFVLKNNVPGAVAVHTAPPVPSLAESLVRQDAAVRELSGLPPSRQTGDNTVPPPLIAGSLAESAARIHAALTGMNDGGGVAAPVGSRLPVVTVPKQTPRADLVEAGPTPAAGGGDRGRRRGERVALREAANSGVLGRIITR